MRTPVKILLALVVIGGGFTVYYKLMADTGLGLEVKKPVPPALPKPTSDGGPQFGGGADAWVTQYDKEGRKQYRFRAYDYTPQRDGTVLVTKPAAEFFLKGQTAGRTRLRITGATGIVYVQQALGQPAMKDGLMKKEDLSADFGQPPRKGRLQDVRIELFEGDDATEPAISLAMNNAVFDNETFRIFTEGFKDAAGKEVAGEWAPVTVTGRYEFIGYGLTIRWNDLDQRLELLKVFHGEKLVIKDASAFSGGLPGPKKAAGASARMKDEGRRMNAKASSFLLPPSALDSPVILAADVIPAATPPVTAPAAVAPGAPYRAKFTQQVVIKQGEQTLVNADEMNIDFLLGSGTPGQPKHQPQKDKQPAPAAATKAAAPATVPEKPATAPAPAATRNAAAATTKPAPEPITVYWRGPLEVVPTSPAAVNPSAMLKAGEVAVEFVGAPLVITRDGGELQCATLVYRTADGGSVLLRNSDRFPRVLVKQPVAVATKPGEPAPAPAFATVSTTSVEYSAITRLATLRGPSTARIPLPSEDRKPNELPDVMEAEWASGAKFYLLGEGGKETAIDRAEFAGDVRVRHPQLDLRAQQLQLAFAPPAPADGKAKDPKKGQPAPVLSSIVATERVQCDVIAANTQRQTVLCDRLSLKTAIAPDGRTFPQIVEATGKVRATDEKQELLAEYVTLTLAPAKPGANKPAAGAAPEAALASAQEKPAGLAPGGLGGGSIELRSMNARQGVLVRSADGALAAGDELTVISGDGDKTKTEVRLIGKPARVEDKDHNILTGPAIVVHPDSGKAEIAGAGTIDAIQKDEKDPKAPGRAIQVSWTEGATVDGPEDLIAVSGNVVAKVPDRDGTMNIAKGQRVEFTLVKKATPATQPTAAPAKNAKPATNPADAVAGRVHMDFFKDKEIGEITLLDEAMINSSQTAPDGTVLREFQMQASRIGFDVIRHKVAVPVGGQMLVRDHRPSEAKKPGEPAQPGEGKGISAFQWSKSLIYDEAQRQATMSGDVVVVHKPDGEGQLPVRLTADDVAATFLPAGGATPPQPKPANGGAPDLTAALRLKALTASGHIVITRAAAQVTADRIEYDPTGEWITASGTPRNPATFSDGTGTGTTSAEVVQWNARTWHVKFKNVAARVR